MRTSLRTNLSHAYTVTEGTTLLIELKAASSFMRVITAEVEVTEVCVEKSSKWRKFFDWFCGMSVEKDDEETAHDSKTKAETGLESSQMMEQTPREKFILRSFLCLLLFTTLLLYVFFSTGSDLGLLRK